MKLTARNQLAGTVTSVTVGAVMAEVIVSIGDQEIVSVVTRASVEALGISEGDAVTAVIKSTEVILAKD